MEKLFWKCPVCNIDNDFEKTNCINIQCGFYNPLMFFSGQDHNSDSQEIKKRKTNYHKKLSELNKQKSQLITPKNQDTSKVITNLGKKISTIMAKSIDNVSSSHLLLVSTNGEYLALGTNDKLIQVYNTMNFQPHGKLLKHNDFIADMKFSPDGNLLFSLSRDGNLKLWANETTRFTEKQFIETGWKTYAFAVSSNSQKVAVGQYRLNDDFNKYIKILKRNENLWEVDQFLLFQKQNPLQILFTNDNNKLLVRTDDGDLFSWDFNKKNNWERINISFKVKTMTFSNCGNYLAIGCLDKSIRILDWPNFKTLSISSAINNHISNISFSLNDSFILVSCFDPWVRIFDSQSLALQGGFFSDNNVNYSAYEINKLNLFAVNGEKYLELWSMN